MKVLKAINNNIVSCVDDSGQEFVAMGRGLGYNTRPGNILMDDQVEKFFRMDNQNETNRLKDLLNSLPIEQVDLCTRLISYAAQTLHAPLSKSIYLTLPDHISFAIKQQKKGASFQNPLLTEVRIFYPEEYAIGKYALELIDTELGIRLPEDEAASIALHLVNAEFADSLSQTMHITQALHNILKILQEWPGLNICRNSLYYDELTVHLKFLVIHAFSNDLGERNESHFVHTIKDAYPQEYKCAEAIAQHLENQSGHIMSSEKCAYLALHIRRVNNVAT